MLALQDGGVLHKSAVWRVGPGLSVTYPDADAIPTLSATGGGGGEEPTAGYVEVSDGDTSTTLATRLAFQGSVVSVASGIATFSFDSRYLQIGATINWSQVSNRPTDLNGYGITDAYTRTQLQTAGQADLSASNVTSGDLDWTRIHGSGSLRGPVRLHGGHTIERERAGSQTDLEIWHATNAGSRANLKIGAGASLFQAQQANANTLQLWQHNVSNYGLLYMGVNESSTGPLIDARWLDQTTRIFRVYSTGAVESRASFGSVRPSNDWSFYTQIAGESNPKHIVFTDGSLYWGAGGSAPLNVNLYRHADNWLRTDDAFSAANFYIGTTEIISAAPTRRLQNVVLSASLVDSGTLSANYGGTNNNFTAANTPVAGLVRWNPAQVRFETTNIDQNADGQTRYLGVTNGSLGWSQPPGLVEAGSALAGQVLRANGDGSFGWGPIFSWDGPAGRPLVYSGLSGSIPIWDAGNVDWQYIDNKPVITGLTPGAAGQFVRSNGTVWTANTIQVGDLPTHTHPLDTGTTGTLAVGRGGTGITTLAVGSILVGNGASAMSALAPGATRNVLIGSSATAWSARALQAADLPAHTHAATEITGFFPELTVGGLSANLPANLNILGGRSTAGNMATLTIGNVGSGGLGNNEDFATINFRSSDPSGSGSGTRAAITARTGTAAGAGGVLMFYTQSSSGVSPLALAMTLTQNGGASIEQNLTAAGNLTIGGNFALTGTMTSGTVPVARLLGTVPISNGGWGRDMSSDLASFGASLIRWDAGSSRYDLTSIPQTADGQRRVLGVTNGSLGWALASSGTVDASTSTPGQVLQSYGTGVDNYAWGIALPNSAPAGGASRVLRYDHQTGAVHFADWSAVDLASGDVTGILSLARGGTGRATAPAGAILVGNALGTAWDHVLPGAGGAVLRSNGSSWVRATLVAGDLPTHSHSAADITSGTLSKDRMLELPVYREDGVPLAPLTVTQGVLFKFTESSQLNSPPGSGTWRHIMQIQGWTAYNASYPTYQLSFGNGAVAVRQAASSTTWDSWRTLAEQAWALATFATAVHSHAASDITTGQLVVARGGTGQGSFTAGNVLLGNGGSALSSVAPGAAGGFLRSNGSAWARAAISSSDLPSTITISGSLTAGAVVASTSFGAIYLRDTSSLMDLHIRPNSGRHGYITFTENGVADRWYMGIAPGDANLYFFSGGIGSGTQRMRIAGNGDGLALTGWFRNTAANIGLYNESTNHYWYSGASEGRWISRSGSGIEIREVGNTVRGYLLHDGSGGNFGLVWSDATWRVRTFSGGVRLYGNIGIGVDPTQPLHVLGTNSGSVTALFELSDASPAVQRVVARFQHGTGWLDIEAFNGGAAIDVSDGAGSLTLQPNGGTTIVNGPLTDPDGIPFRAMVISTATPSGTAQDGTVWLQYA
jgi:hypothetical protein